MKEKLLRIGIRWLCGGIIREIADGKRGARAQGVYLALKGRKTLWGFAVALIGGALAAFAPDWLAAIGPYVLLAGGLAVNAGLLDKVFHAAPPAFIGQALHTLISAGPVLSIAAAAAAHALGGPWPDRVDLYAAAVGEATAFLAAFLAAPPTIVVGD